MFKNKKNQYTFERFLSGMPASDYIFQNMSYNEQIKRACKIIEDADYVLIGAGAGMSTAAGAIYGGEWFERNFGEFQEKYGKGPYMQDMYSAGFYPFPDEESFWGYWSKHALLGGIHLDVTPLHKQLLEIFMNKKIFVLSTNVDRQFIKAGLEKDKIFYTQGDYFHIQCLKGCHPKTYDASKLFEKMDKVRKDCKIPTYMVPKCPVCGGAMHMNLRSDQYFVQDDSWYASEKRFNDFLVEAIESQKNICLFEVGVGFNTPTIIRFPFEKLARENKRISLIRLNIKEAVVPESLGMRAIGINEDIKKSIKDIHDNLDI
jgi:NAD-dependent SIR2 family protein deacetylase